jgi:hypothetical protein
MKKFNSSLKNPNVQATIVIVTVFLITAAISVFFILAD